MDWCSSRQLAVPESVNRGESIIFASDVHEWNRRTARTRQMCCKIYRSMFWLWECEYQHQNSNNSGFHHYLMHPKIRSSKTNNLKETARNVWSTTTPSVAYDYERVVAEPASLRWVTADAWRQGAVARSRSPTSHACSLTAVAAHTRCLGSQCSGFRKG